MWGERLKPPLTLVVSCLHWFAVHLAQSPVLQHRFGSLLRADKRKHLFDYWLRWMHAKLTCLVLVWSKFRFTHSVLPIFYSIWHLPNFPNNTLLGNESKLPCILPQGTKVEWWQVRINNCFFASYERFIMIHYHDKGRIPDGADIYHIHTKSCVN